MELYVMRHGKAAERDPKLYPSDDQRPLTEKGKAELEWIAAAMERLEMEFDLVLSSPLLRARQTAEIVAKALGITKKVRYSDLLAQPDIKPLIDHIKSLQKREPSILLVGHEPYLSELVSTLLTGTTDLNLNFKKGGLLKLQLKKTRLEWCASLDWLMTPRQLIQIAEE